MEEEYLRRPSKYSGIKKKNKTKNKQTKSKYYQTQQMAWKRKIILVHIMQN